MRGFSEEGTTTTPFDMVVRNEMSRYHPCMEALRGQCRQMLARHDEYILRAMEDLPEVRDWTWADGLKAR